MKNKILLFILIFITIVYPKNNANAQDRAEQTKDIAICLKNKGFTMYGATNCSACAIEKGYFGENFPQIRYVNCDEYRDICNSKNIHAYPTWEDATGKQYKGAAKLTTLSDIANCSYIKNQQTQPVSTINYEILSQFLSAFIAGLISFLAPCLLPLLPSYFTVITGFTFSDLYGLDFENIRGRVFVSTLFFAAGFTLVYTLLGATGFIVGQLIDMYLPMLLRLSGIFLVILGLVQTGVVKPFSLEFDYAWRVQKRLANLGFATAAITGIASGLSWIPCVSPLLTPILILSAKSETVIYGTLLLFTYSLGLTLPFLAGGLFFPTIVNIFKEHRNAFHRLSILAGIFIIIFGVILILNQYQLYIDKLNNLKNIFPSGL